MGERKAVLIRIDPALHDALQRWAAAEFRSFNSQVEYLLRAAVAQAGRLPSDAAEAGDSPQSRKE